MVCGLMPVVHHLDTCVVLGWPRRAVAVANRAGGGLWLDVILYGLSAFFAWATAEQSTLAAHRAWGAVAGWGYLVATVVATAQLVTGSRSRHRRPQWWWGAAGRTVLVVSVWVATAVLPLVTQAVQRAAGRPDRAQEEVLVVEDGGQRLVETGTPYLDRTAIDALPDDERLLGYLPYQPGMAVFGVPRALDPSTTWWSDARLWFALVTATALALALMLLRQTAVAPAALVRALQVATVAPVAALTLATGGDDLPVLGLCLLGLALAATGQVSWAGLALGAAASLKLFAWPVAFVLGIYAYRRHRSVGWRYTAAVVALPLLTALPVLAQAPAAMAENVVAFPLGWTSVTSPAASPLPGHLLAEASPHGRSIATALLLAAGAAVAAALARRPPRTAAEAATWSGLGLLAAIMLMPATRFGYLLYPVALLVWTYALSAAVTVPRSVHRDPKRRTPQVRVDSRRQGTLG